VTHWLQQTGYVRLWQRVHHADEAAIMSHPIARVIAEARFDELRVTGSTIENRDDLVAMLRASAEVLIGYAKIATAAPRQAAVAAAAGAAPVTALPGGGAQLPATPAPEYTRVDERLAREQLRQVRRAINEFRDDCRLGLVRARNQLWRTVTGTMAVSYLLVALSIRAGAPPAAVTAGGIFFLVGAIVGMFNKLYLDSMAQTAVEDYGLSTARLVSTPVFSGLAAVGGVLLLPLLSALLSAQSLGQPSVQPAGEGASQIAAQAVPKLQAIFNVTDQPFGLVVAAMFGLSPSTLISRLQAATDQYKTGLKSSQAPQNQTTTP